MEHHQLCPKELPDIERGVSADVMLDIDPTYLTIPEQNVTETQELSDEERIKWAEEIQEKDIRAQRLQELEEKYEDNEFTPHLPAVSVLGRTALKNSSRQSSPRRKAPKISRRSQAWGYSASVSDPNLR